jgi:uncharacterized membrane protein YfcA
MPVWMELMPVMIQAIIILLILVHRNKNNKKCVDLSSSLVAFWGGTLLYSIGTGTYTNSELSNIVVGGLVIYTVCYFASAMIIASNKTKLEK